MKNTIIYTIGYEKISIDEYLKILVNADVKVLVDVRNNQNSRKHEFSKNNLKNSLNNIWIDYLSKKELGIEKINRKNAKTLDDYLKIFEIYKKTLPSKKEYFDDIIILLKDGKNIALWCYEHDYTHCHRNYTSRYLEKLTKNKYPIIHL